MIKHISFNEAIEALSKSSEDTWGIGYSNRACALVNTYVRFHSKKELKVCPGDALIATQTLYHSKISNGDRFIVEELGRSVLVDEWVPRQDKKIELTLQSLTLRNIYSQEKHTVLTCLDLLDSEQSSLTIPQKQALIIYRNKVSENSIKRKEFLYDPIVHPGIFRFSWCSTCYKVQGGEADHIILMVRSLDEIKRYPNGNNFIYTSVTRARKTLSICEDPRL